MARKAPRRTAERILEVTLALFNRFGEPNVSTTLISAEMKISPGNLYYHYPAKDELINALVDRHDKALADYSEAIRLEPQNPEGLIGRAGIYVRLGDMDGAITDYNAAIKLQPADPAPTMM